MKKLICVMALVCIGMLLVSCGSKRLDNPKAQFIRDFGLHIDKKDCVLEELFNNYEGFPYEGIFSSELLCTLDSSGLRVCSRRSIDSCRS